MIDGNTRMRERERRRQSEKSGDRESEGHRVRERQDERETGREGDRKRGRQEERERESGASAMQNFDPSLSIQQCLPHLLSLSSHRLQTIFGLMAAMACDLCKNSSTNNP